MRVTYLKEQKYYVVGVDLSEEDFDRLNSNSSRKELRSVKAKIKQFENKVDNIIENLSEFSFSDFQAAMNQEMKMNFRY